MFSSSKTGHIQAGLERLGRLRARLGAGGLSSRDVGTALRLQRDLQKGLQQALERLRLTSDQIKKAIASGQFQQK